MWTPLDKQPRSPSEGDLSGIKEEGGCDEENDHGPEKYFAGKKVLETFRDIEHAKDEMLEADPGLKRNRQFCRGVEKTYGKLSDEKASTAETTFDTILQESKIL